MTSAESFESRLSLHHHLNAILGKYCLCKFLCTFFGVEEFLVFKIRNEWRFNLVVLQLVFIYDVEERMTKYFSHIILIAKSLLSVFFKELRD